MNMKGGDIRKYQTILQVLYILEQNKRISTKRFKEITGIYEADIKEELIELNAIEQKGYGDFKASEHTTDAITYFKNKIISENTKQESIALDMESKKATIKATRLATAALIISIISLTGIIQSLSKWIINTILNHI